jgi:hypothetical protein
MMHESRDAALQIIAANKTYFGIKWPRKGASALHSSTFPGAESPKVHAAVFTTSQLHELLLSGQKLIASSVPPQTCFVLLKPPGIMFLIKPLFSRLKLQNHRLFCRFSQKQNYLF